MSLYKLGFKNELFSNISNENNEPWRLFRVLAVHKDNYAVSDGEIEIRAEVTGKLMFNAGSPLEYPVVGDYVKAEVFDGDTFAIIHEIVPRQTLLKRKVSGKKVEFQAIAANIDTALIMQSVDANFNLRRLERYLAMINEAGIVPVVLLSKTDLISESELQEKTASIRSVYPAIRIIAFSNADGTGLDSVLELLNPQETYCMVGSSGVGKTSLLNSLLGSESYETYAVRQKDSRGRHTTTRRELVILQNGALMIDTPGMRELGNIAIEDGIRETFDEIDILAENCKFSDCTHTSEKGCAVLKAVKSGELPPQRYANYIKMVKESQHYERTYLEKRQRDKAFGKMVKSVLKNHIKR